MKNPIVIFVLVAMIFCSCHSTRKIQSAISGPVDTTRAIVTQATDHGKEDSIAFIRSVYSTIQSNRINFTSFSGKIELDYEDGNGNKYNVNAHVRMHKDSVIWISITAILGIEGLRVYITPDSVKVLDKQNKVYKVRNIAYLQEVTGLPLDLPTLQDLLIGNAVFLDSGIRSYSKSGAAISLYSQSEFFTNFTTVNETDRLLQSSKLDDIDVQKSRTCYITWSDYENKKGVNFPQKRTIHVIDKAKLDIKMEYKQYDFNEKLSFPFSVPKNYDQN